MFTKNRYSIKKNRYNNNENTITEQGIRKYKDFFLGNPQYGLISLEDLPPPPPIIIEVINLERFNTIEEITPFDTRHFDIPSDKFGNHQIVADENGLINQTVTYNKQDNYEYATFLAYIEGTDLYWYITYVVLPTTPLRTTITLENRNTKLIPGERYVLRTINILTYDMYFKSIITFNNTETNIYQSATYFPIDLRQEDLFSVNLEASRLGYPQFIFNKTNEI